jgi:hypothetical protein
MDCSQRWKGRRRTASVNGDVNYMAAELTVARQLSPRHRERAIIRLR